VRAALSGALMLSATALELASINAPTPAQTLNHWKCTGNPDIPWDQQIVGCTNAIKSGRYTGKDLAAVFNGRGTAYRATGDFTRAIQDYDQAIKLNPNDATAFYYRGIANGKRGDPDRAIQDFGQAIKLNPNHVGAWYSRGLTYSNKGLWDRAIQDFDLAITLNPNYSDALNNRGLAYISKGQYDRAIEDFDQVLKFDPKDADAIKIAPWPSQGKTPDSRCQIAQGRKGASFEAFLKRHPMCAGRPARSRG
jgi:tetratricopeptide (TPR) repeat protein